MKITDKFDWPETFAVVSQNIASNWVKFYEWAGADTKKFTGHFLNVEDAIKAVPQKYRTIKVDITDNDGKPISYTVNRDAPTARQGNGEHILQQMHGGEYPKMRSTALRHASDVVRHKKFTVGLSMSRNFFEIVISRSFSIGFTIYSPHLNGWLSFEVRLACFIFRFDCKGTRWFGFANYWNG